MTPTFTIVASLSYILVAVLLHFLNHVSYPKNHNEEKAEDTFGARDLLAQLPPRQVDEMCSETTKYCFLISEYVQNVSGRVLVFRELQLKQDGPQLRLSYARVLVPKQLSYPMLLNTRSWKIDKTTVLLTYARTMIAGVFFSDAVKYDSPKIHNVLIIGLGGGVINNYLSSMPNQKLNITVVDIDPVMKRVAEKWYGFQESNLHRIVIDDGIEYSRKASEKGEKFDAILLDLCTNERRPLLCPIEEFLTETALESLASILSDTGAVIVNIIKGNEYKDAKNEPKKVQKRFQNHFAACSMLYNGNEEMLFCFNKIEPHENRTDSLSKMEAVIDKKLGFHITDGEKYLGSDIE
ncbi:hypothetical protein RB195_015279 [Necator americanus]|uniref:Spermine/spermidine synthase n=1 Tax=Necator americanus TaxID=51031 RepID=A0ABR1E3U9_NECAM